MSPAEIPAELHEHCPLCGRQPTGIREDADRAIWHITCAVCSQYGISEELLLMFRSGEMPSAVKLPLSAVARRRFDYTHRPEVITSTNCRDLASSVPAKNDVLGKIRYLLLHIARRSSFPGDLIAFNAENDYPLCFATTRDEFRFYARYIFDAGLVEGQKMDMHGQCQLCLTAKGWEEAKRVPTLESPNAFVAMSFLKEGSLGASLTQAFEQAIKPAIEDDAGYSKAIRIDREDFLGDIVFEIIARIRECRFLVADVTGHRNGVYFEAGYAMGMGLPVIWTCHKDDLAKAHFDTRNLNHIEWTDPAELRRKLANRILATIGRGPKKTN